MAERLESSKKMPDAHAGGPTSDTSAVDINALLERLDKTFRENSQRVEDGLAKMKKQLDELDRSLQALQGQVPTEDKAGNHPGAEDASGSAADASAFPSLPDNNDSKDAPPAEQEDENLV